MNARLRILHLEDNPVDAELIGETLRADGSQIEMLRVETREAFLEALESEEIDLVLSDYSMNGFDGVSAMLLARERRPKLPFLFVSGTLGEERALAAVQQGAWDCISKENLSRLVSSVRLAVNNRDENRRREESEEKVREQAALLDKAQDAIFVADVRGRILYWNRSAEQLYGWSADDAVGLPLETLATEEAIPDTQRAFERTRERGEWIGELRHRTKSGGRVVVESRWTLVRADDGQPRSIFIINTDLTKRKESERSLLRAQRLESIGSLAGGIAHDLNNVLAPILLGVQILRDRIQDNQCDGILTTIESSAERGIEMIRQVLSFARGSEGKLTRVALPELLDELTRFTQETFPRNIEVCSQVPGDLWAVMGDATQIYQVLMNLLVNARDALSSGGRVNVRAENIFFNQGDPKLGACEPGSYVKLTVEDNGPGVPEHLHEKIFEPFFTTKADGQGTGLGLSTLVKIVENHDGFVCLESAPGQGASFRVYIPAQAEESPSFNQAGSTESAGCILVVDDEVSIQEIVRAMLEAYNYRVITATSGEEALRLHREHHSAIDLVVIDWLMPDMDGPRTIRELRKVDPQVRYIGISGNLGKRSPTDWPEDQPLKLLPKPFSPRLLLDTVRTMLSET